MPEAEQASSSSRAVVLAVLAWLVPGVGHLALKRTGRAVVFMAVIAVALLVGLRLDGNLYRPVAGEPLSWLATGGAMGAGAPYIVMRWLFGYHGDPSAAGYEYGTAFLLSAGLMNLLLVLDTWDIANGHKD